MHTLPIDRSHVALIAAMLLSACVFTPKPRYAKANYSAAQVEGRTIRVVDSAGHYSALILEADWVVDGDRQCIRDGELSLVTPAGSVALYRTSACVMLEPFSLVGEAEVPFPGLGYLGRIGVTGNSPRAKIALGSGAAIGALEVSGAKMELNPNLFYLSVDYFSGLSATLGSLTLSTPAIGARLIVSPQEPMLYVSGSVPGLIDDAGIGFSADGRLPFKPNLALHDGDRWKRQTFHGHILAHGTVPIPGYPLSIAGRLLIDVDANRNGRTVFEGESADMRVAADGTLMLGYDKAGFGFSVELAKSSLSFDSSRHVASFHSQAGGALFKNTPLSFLGPQAPTFTVRGFFQTPSNFEISASIERSMLAGFSTSKTTLRLGNAGIRLDSTVKLPGIGRAAVEGRVLPNGKFDLRGRANITIGGFRMAAADITVGSSGVRVAGVVTIPNLGEVKVSGSIEPNGRFSLRGRGDLRPAGLRLANASVTVSPDGASISGGVTFLGSRFSVSGSAKARGGFKLSGSVSVKAVALRGRVALDISSRGAGASFLGRACVGKKCRDLAGFAIDSRGRICPVFPVIGRKCIRVFKK